MDYNVRTFSKKFLNDFNNIFYDFNQFYFGVYTDFNNNLFFSRFKLYLTRFNDLRKYFLKKHIYTINHKRIALNYLYFSM